MNCSFIISTLQNYIRLKPFSHFMNGDICGIIFFAWVDPIFCTTNVKRWYDQIYAFWNVIAAEVCLLIDYGVIQITVICVNSRVPTTVRHGYSLHRICLKLLTQVPDVCPLTDAETIDLIPSRLESQTSVCRLTQKLFGSIPSRLDSRTSVRWLTLKLFDSSPSHLTFDRHRNCWLTSKPTVLRPSQPLTTHVLDVCSPTVTETKMSSFVCTAQN